MSKSRRIAVNTRFLISNRLEGIGNFAFETLKRIVHSHPEIQFFFLFDREYSREFVFAENVTPIVLFPPARHPVLWWWWFELSVARWLRKHSPDLFLSPDGFGCLHTEIPQVLVIHDLAFEHFSKHVPFIAAAYYKHYTPLYARKAKRIATVSEYSKNDIISIYGIDADSIDVVFNAAKEGYGPREAKVKAVVKEKYTGGSEFFLYVGSIHPRKNVSALLKSFDKYKADTKSDHRLLIVGRQAWDADDVRITFEHMHHGNDVIFTGYVSAEELMNITSSASAMMFISLFEGFGVPIIEAMASGVPVITSNTTSMPEIAGDAALLVDPYSVDEISTAMKRIATDVDLRASLIEKGYSQAKKFSWDLSAEKLWKTCEKVLETHGGLD